MSTGRVSHDYCSVQMALPESVASAAINPAPIPTRTFGRNDAAPLEYCQRDENWLTHTLAWFRDGRAECAARPVHLETDSPDVDTIPPKPRVY